MKRIWTPGDDDDGENMHPLLSKCPLCMAAGNDHVLYASIQLRKWVCNECGFSCEPGRVPSLGRKVYVT